MSKQYFDTIYKMEDVQNGMYSNSINEENVFKSVNLLSNLELFKRSIEKVFDKWKISTAVNLSNKSINRKAWLGQSACLINHNANERETKKAWFLMTEKQRELANYLAEQKIKEFDRTWNGKLNSISTLGKNDVISMGYQMRLNLEWKN